MKKEKTMNGTLLKVIALVAMTLDHIGMILYPGVNEFRVVGRLAYPIFAYMIAEGFRYTRYRWRYFSIIWVIGLVCSVIDYIARGSLYQSIFITFAISILYMLGSSYVKDQYKHMTRYQHVLWALICIVVLGLTAYICYGKPIPGFIIDYGFWGIVTPVIIFLANTKTAKFIALTVGLRILSFELGPNQIYALWAVPLLALYNGERGPGFKLLFYVYYPLHLGVLYMIKQIYW